MNSLLHMANTLVQIWILNQWICMTSASFGVDLDSTLARWGGSSYPSVSDQKNRSRVTRQATDGRVTVDFPDDAVLEFSFKLVIPYWTYGSAKAKGDYRVEITFELPNHLRRRRRSLSEDQATLYSIISDGLTKSGLDGETCIQRTICELAEEPLYNYGMFGDLINLIFLPGYHTEDPTEDHVHAEDYGRSFGGCWAAFPHCPVTMRDVVLDFIQENSNIPGAL